MSCRHFAQQEYFHWIGMRSNCVIQFSPLLLLLHRQLGMFIFRCIVQDVLHSPCMAKSSCPLFTEEEHAQFAKKIYDLVSDTRYNQWWDCYHPQPEDKSVCETKTLLHDTIQTANSLAFHRLDTTVRLCMVSDLLYCWLMAHIWACWASILATRRRPVSNTLRLATCVLSRVLALACIVIVRSLCTRRLYIVDWVSSQSHGQQV